MNPTKKWAVVVPMANEEHDFYPFISALQKELDMLKSGSVFLIVDNVSKDKTLELCRHLSENDKRFHTIWAPENRNVVDAYIRGYKEALKNSDAEFIIEMDAGLSHDPASMGDSPAKRQSLSKTGTILSNLLLGTKLHDMTSGYQGFQRNIVEKFTAYELKSKAHFYQTEIRYLLRKYPSKEIPIQYQAPSPRVSKKAITNSIETLLYYFWRRITFRSISI